MLSKPTNNQEVRDFQNPAPAMKRCSAILDMSYLIHQVEMQNLNKAGFSFEEYSKALNNSYLRNKECQEDPSYDDSDEEPCSDFDDLDIDFGSENGGDHDFFGSQKPQEKDDCPRDSHLFAHRMLALRNL